MSDHSITAVLRRLGGQLRDDSTDRQLLERYGLRGDERAFELLIVRHGPMVLGVCRRMLLETHDADDAFQATFLVLARKASAAGWRDSVAGWLCGTAFRVARRTRVISERRRSREVQMPDLAAPSSDRTELCRVLDEELQRLPEKYRLPVVLCYLEGKTNDEAARDLHCPTGTVKGRLAHARDLLRARLIRRGLAMTAVGGVALFESGLLSAAAGPELASITLKAATGVAAGQAAVTGITSASVATLVNGVTREMIVKKLQWITLTLLAVAALGAGIGWLASPSTAAHQDATAATDPATPSATPAPEIRETKAVGWSTIEGQIVADVVPEREVIDVTADRPACLAKGKLYSEKWVVNEKNHGVRWVIVSLAPIPGSGVKLPIHPALAAVSLKRAEMDQPCCQFEPHVLALREGQEVVVKNTGVVPHNVNWTAKNPRLSGNLIVPAKGEILIKELKAQNLPVPVQCDMHKWMNAKIAVFDHPYFAVTDINGRFTIANAPAGEWRLKVWHEAIGWRGGAAGRDGAKVVVKENGATDVGKLELKVNPE